MRGAAGVVVEKVKAVAVKRRLQRGKTGGRAARQSAVFVR